MLRVVVATVVVVCVTACGSRAAPKVVQPRTVAEVKRAFADHGIGLVLVQPSFGARVRFRAFFAQSGSLSLSVRVYVRVRAARSVPGTVSVRNVVATWQGADSRSVEAAMDQLR